MFLPFPSFVKDYRQVAKSSGFFFYKFLTRERFFKDFYEKFDAGHY